VEPRAGKWQKNLGARIHRKTTPRGSVSEPRAPILLRRPLSYTLGSGSPRTKHESFMRVLVTGGAGFIGSHTVDRLVSLGHEVRILDSLEKARPPEGHPGAPEPRGRVPARRRDEPRRPRLRAERASSRDPPRCGYQDINPANFSKFFRVNAVAPRRCIYELIVRGSLP
jgi:hypothetical protein